MRVIALGLPLFGCTQETIQVETAGVEPQGFVMGPVLRHPPRAAVSLREEGGNLEADVQWVGMCARSERGIQRRVQITKTKVSTTGTVVSGIVAGGGVAFYMLPDAEAEVSLTAGSLLIAAGAIPYLIAASTTGEAKTELPDREVRRPAASTACVVGPARDEPIVLKSGDAELRGQTNSVGRARFDTTLSRPVEAVVRGQRAMRVEWRE